MSTAALPDTLSLAAPVDLTAAGAGPGKRPTFEMLAYAGTAPVNLAGWPYPVVIDLAGLRVDRDKLPVLLDHDPRRIIGQATARIDPTGVSLAGTITGEGPDAQEVLAHARNGFEWQASVGASVERREFVESGKTAKVNGREFTGPLYVARQALLHETSFVAYGADRTTQVAVKAKGAPMPQSTIVTGDPATPPPDPAAAERRRIQDIRAALAAIPDPDDFRAAADQAIESGESAVDFKARLVGLRELRLSRPNVTLFGRGWTPKGSGGGGGNPREMIAASALLMAGQDEAAAKHFGERAVAGLRRPHGWLDLMAFALHAEGRDVPHDKHEIIRAAFTTSSLSNALGLGVNKLALDAFTESSVNWRAIGKPVSVADFKDGRAVRLSPSVKLEELPPGGEIKHGLLEEEVFNFRLRTYSKMIGLTRESIINDDLSLLDDLPMIMGNEAAKKITDLVFDSLIGNVDGDGNPYYSAGNGNLIHEALDVSGLSEAIRVLRTRKGPDNRIIGYQPATLVVPAALEQTARALLNSLTLQRDQAADMQPTANPLASVNIGLIVEPRLDDDSQTDWYVFSRPMDSAVLVAFLNGKQAPTVESADQPFNMLGTQWRVYLDVGASLAEHRATVKSDVTPYQS